MEMKVKNKSHQSSLSDQNVWKSKLKALIEQDIHLRIAWDGRYESSWDIDTVDELRKKITQEMAAELQKESNRLTTSVMKAARYGNYLTIEQQLMVQLISIEPVGGKTILHMVLEGVISSKYEDDPAKICMENIIAGKEVCDAIIDAYFPPDNFTLFPEENPDHYKCLEYILKNVSPEKLDINFGDDAGNSALHYAVAWSDAKATRALLQAGAYTCKANKKGMTPLKIISPAILEEFLDNCVLSNDYPLGHDDFQIYFNYQLFIHPKKQVPREKDGIEGGTGEVQYYGSRESEPIFVMDDRPDLRKFLAHPLIRNYLCLKWLIVKKYWYIENVLFLWFFLLFAIYLLLNVINIYTPSMQCDSDAIETGCCDLFIKNIDHTRKFNTFFHHMGSTFGGSLVILRVLLLIFIVHRHYYSPKTLVLKSLRTWSQMIWVVVIYLFVFLHGYDYFYLFLVIMIIALCIEFVLVLGRSPEYSIGIQMVKVFVVNVCKYLSEFFIVILFLAISFVVFFNTGYNIPLSNRNSTGTNTTINFTCRKHIVDFDDSNYTVDANNTERADRAFPLYIMETFITMLRGDPQVKTFMPFDDIPLSHAIFLMFCFIAVYTINNLMIVLPMMYANQVAMESKSVVMVSFLKFVMYVETTASRDPIQLLDFLNKISLWFVFGIRWCLRRNPKPPEPFCKRISVTYTMKNCTKEPCVHNEKTLKYLSLGSEIFDNAVNILKRTKQQNETEKQIHESESRLEKIEKLLQDTRNEVQENQRIMEENQRAVQENEEKLRKDLLNNYEQVITRLELLQASMDRDHDGSSRKLERRNTE